MPFPRRVIIYLREKEIPSSLVQVVQVSDPPRNEVLNSQYPPKPPGSLPILAIPSSNSSEPTVYIRQSLAIMEFLDELCDAGSHSFPKSQYCLRGATALDRARVSEVITVAAELDGNWNAVRLFGTGAGPVSIPVAAKESLRWVKRSLDLLNQWWADRDMSVIRKDSGGQITMADIVIYQFLDFIRTCYGKDLTIGSGERTKDVYGREVEEKYDKLKEFFDAFETRDSARRVQDWGEMPGEASRKVMTDWAEGIW